jgi:hypothetical protein
MTHDDLALNHRHFIHTNQFSPYERRMLALTQKAFVVDDPCRIGVENA